MRNDINFAVVAPLYCAGIAWTLVYDTIYAHQDKRDDIKVGIRSTALLFGDQTKPVLSCFALAFSSCLIISGIQNDMSLMYHVTSVCAGSHLFWQIFSVDLDNSKDCLNKFTSNKYVGAVVMAGIAADLLSKSELSSQIL